LLVVVAGLVAYHNSFMGPFILDDVPSIQNNPTIRHLWPIWQTLSPPHTGGATVEGRPLVNLSLALNYALGGYDVWGYHALNLTIHILAGLTLFAIMRRTLLQPRLRQRFGVMANELALAVALIWTVHPLQTESVTYIIQRAESLMGLFYLLTLYSFIRAAESPRPRTWYGLCLATCALGMASKEVMASAPLLVMLYDRAFLSGSWREAWRRRWKLYLALASTWILLGYLLFFTGSFHNALVNARKMGIGRWPYLLTEPGVILHYLQLSVWPHPLCLDYDGWPFAKLWTSILPPALVLLALLGSTVWACKTNSAWGVLGAWFFLILAPTSSIIPTDSPAYEHRMYLSLAAVVVVVVLGIHALVGRRTIVVAAVLAIGLGALTWRRNENYRSQLAIWNDTVAKSPQSPRAHNNLGIALAQAGRVPEAIGQYEEAIRINPNYAEAHDNLGATLGEAGNFPEAIAQFMQVLRINPDSAAAHDNLADALLQEGRLPDAIEHYQQALRITPDFADAHYNLGIAFGRSGRMTEATEQLEEALRIKPDYAEAHFNLGMALGQQGRIEDAIAHYEQAIRIKPDYAEAHFNLGIALAMAGRTPEAIEHLQQVLRIKPRFTPARDALARLHASQ